MEGATDPSTSVQTSLDVILDQMEVSTDPDINSLELITACAEDLLLGGEVEIREISDVAEVRNPPASQKQQDADGVGEALIIQGGAEGVGDRPEETIGMEVEVTRKSSCSSDSVSPTAVDDTGDRAGILPNPSGWSGTTDAGGPSHSAAVEEERGPVVEPRQTIGERGRKKELYIPPVTEWRDFLDSQDIIQEFSRNREREEGDGGRERIQGEVAEDEGEETNKKNRGLVASEDEEDIDVESGSEGYGGQGSGGGGSGAEGSGVEGSVDQGGAVEEVDIGEEPEPGGNEMVEIEPNGAHQHSLPVPESMEESSRAGEPNHLEMFLPQHAPLYRQASLTRRTSTDRSRDLKIAEQFLEHETTLLVKATWFPETSKEPPSGATLATGEARQRGNVQRAPVNISPLVGASPQPHTSSSNTLQCDPLKKASEMSSTVRHRTTVVARREETATEAQSTESPVTTRRPIEAPVPLQHNPRREWEVTTRAPVIKSPVVSNTTEAPAQNVRKKSGVPVLQTNARKATNGLVIPPSPRRDGTATEGPSCQSMSSVQPELQYDPVTAILRDRDTNSHDSFFDHDSQMDVGEGEEEKREGPTITLCSPSASSEYESAVDIPIQPQDPDKVPRNDVDKQIKEMRIVPASPSTTAGSTGDPRPSGRGLGDTDNLLPSQNQRESLSPKESSSLLSTLQDTTVGIGGAQRTGALIGVGGKRKRPRTKKCYINIQKIPLDKKLRAAADRFSSEETDDAADFTSNMFFLQVPARPRCERPLDVFHDFVARIPLPSVCTSPPSTENQVRRRKGQKISEGDQLRYRDPSPSDDALSHPLFDSSVRPTAAAPAGWIDRLVDRIPETVLTGRRTESNIETESEVKVDSLPDRTFQRRRHPSTSTHTQSSATPPAQPGNDQVLYTTCV